MLDRDPVHVAIDGPAGSGKSSVARELSQRLGLVHLDTGAMYRALTWVVLEEELAPDDGPALAARLEAMDLRLAEGSIHADGADITVAIREDRVTGLVSQVSAHAPVRVAMVQRQRALAEASTQGAVLEGRDIGSRVLPLARCKIYLDASARVRALRRVRQMKRNEDEASVASMEQEIVERDRKDSTRAHSPLLVSPDAHVIDTSEMDFEQVVEACAGHAQEAESYLEDDRPSGQVHLVHWQYKAAHVILNFLYSVFAGGLRVYGRDHQHARSGFIYSSNHVSNLDPPALGAALTREVYFLAKSELFFWPLAPAIRFMNAIPIIRGRFDAKAFEAATERLTAGFSILIFPEGTRRPVGRPGPVKKGLGLLAIMSQHPYVPCHVSGTKHFWRTMLRLQPLEVRLGPPVRLHAIEHLRQLGLSENQIHVRVGDLFLEQLRSLGDRARGNRSAS